MALRKALEGDNSEFFDSEYLKWARTCDSFPDACEWQPSCQDGPDYCVFLLLAAVLDLYSPGGGPIKIRDRGVASDYPNGRPGPISWRPDLARHQSELAWDPAVKRFRMSEGSAGIRLESIVGRLKRWEKPSQGPLSRKEISEGQFDWSGSGSQIFELKGTGPSYYWNKDEWAGSIDRHFRQVARLDVDVTLALDLSGLNEAQVAQAAEYLGNLSPEQASTIIIVPGWDY